MIFKSFFETLARELNVDLKKIILKILKSKERYRLAVKLEQ